MFHKLSVIPLNVDFSFPFCFVCHHYKQNESNYSLPLVLPHNFCIAYVQPGIKVSKTCRPHNFPSDWYGLVGDRSWHAPVSCFLLDYTNVTLECSTDGGLCWPHFSNSCPEPYLLIRIHGASCFQVLFVWEFRSKIGWYPLMRQTWRNQVECFRSVLGRISYRVKEREEVYCQNDRKAEGCDNFSMLYSYADLLIINWHMF